MGQGFTEVFDETDQVRSTMESIFENTRTLKSSFSGSGTPANPEIGMLWADTSSNFIKVRGASEWLEIMDLDTGNIYLEDGSVEARHIDSSARKPEIVQGEEISPDRITNMTACNLRAHSGAFFPCMPSGSDEHRISPPSSWTTLNVSKVYWPGSTSSTTISMHIYGSLIRSFFAFNTSPSPSVLTNSSSQVYVAGQDDWSSGSNVAVYTASAGISAGWYYIKLRGLGYTSVDTGILSGYTFGVSI